MASAKLANPETPATPAPAYRRVRGATFAFGMHRLWRGEDHLLTVASTFGVERYRRFYLRDIEAIIARRTPARLWWNIVWGAILVLSILGVIGLYVAIRGSAGVDGGPVGGWLSYSAGRWVLFGLFGSPVPLLACTILVVNSLRGPTCACSFQTRTGIQRVPALARIRVVERLVGDLAMGEFSDLAI